MIRQRLHVARMYLLFSRGLEPALKENVVRASEWTWTHDPYIRGKMFLVFVFKAKLESFLRNHSSDRFLNRAVNNNKPFQRTRH